MTFDMGYGEKTRPPLSYDGSLPWCSTGLLSPFTWILGHEPTRVGAGYPLCTWFIGLVHSLLHHSLGWFSYTLIWDHKRNSPLDCHKFQKMSGTKRPNGSPRIAGQESSGFKKDFWGMYSIEWKEFSPLWTISTSMCPESEGVCDASPWASQTMEALVRIISLKIIEDHPTWVEYAMHLISSKQIWDF